MTRYPIQLHYPDTKLTNPCHVLLMLITRPGRNKYQFNKSLVWLNREPHSRSPTREARPPPVKTGWGIEHDKLLEDIRMNFAENLPRSCSGSPSWVCAGRTSWWQPSGLLQPHRTSSPPHYHIAILGDKHHHQPLQHHHHHVIHHHQQNQHHRHHC